MAPMHPKMAHCVALGEQLCELSAQITAATCHWLELLAEFDAELGWAQDGCRSCAHWLNWKCGVSLVAAREKVRVAGALACFPKICAAFARGEVSYSKVRAMTRVATAESEDYLLMIARHGTAAHVETVVRGYRRVERQAEADAAHAAYAGRSFTWRYDEGGCRVFTVKLALDDAERLIQAVEGRWWELRAQREDNADASAEASNEACRADAFMDLISDKADTEVVVHVSADALCDDGAQGACQLEDGPGIPPESARRLACDAGIVRLLEDPDGLPLDVGRKTRSIPSALKRALKARDGGCCFPGCNVTHRVEGHHVKHWSRGGETSLSNVALLCSHHHHLVHEGGFGMETHEGDLRFRRPDGSSITHAPPDCCVDVDAAALVRNHNSHRGMHIDHHTGVTKWDGVPMDNVQAVEGLLQAHRML